MAENQIRLSQLIGYYGPGAMLDLPDRSVLVMGLDDWDQRSGAFRLIEEPRLSRLLRLRLQDGNDGRLATNGDPQLRTPPLDLRDPRRPSPKVRVKVFPHWFVCDVLPGDPPDRRRLVRFQQLEAPKRLDYRGDDGKRRRVSPIRFVCGCEDGHLQDVDWRRVVHQSAPGREGCQEPLWLEDGGTTGDPRQTRVYCECDASLSLNDLFLPGRLGPCRAEWPWIDNGRDPNGCTHMLRLLTRSATNTYFPQVTRIISLPTAVDQLAELVRSVWSSLQSCSSADDVALARRFNPQPRRHWKIPTPMFGRASPRWAFRRSRGTSGKIRVSQSSRYWQAANLSSARPHLTRCCMLKRLQGPSGPKQFAPATRPLFAGRGSPVAGSGLLVWLHKVRTCSRCHGRVRGCRSCRARRAARPQPAMASRSRAIRRGSFSYP